MIAAPGKCHPLWQQPTCCLDTLSCNFVKIFPIDFVGLSPSLFPLSCCLPVVLNAGQKSDQQDKEKPHSDPVDKASGSEAKKDASL